LIKELLDSRQAAAYLRAARQTLAKWRVYGIGPRWAKWGRSIYYERADLDAWIDGQKHASTAELSMTTRLP
jgi:hypothetical protein